jgi:hypothetical protein
VESSLPQPATLKARATEASARRKNLNCMVFSS